MFIGFTYHSLGVKENLESIELHINKLSNSGLIGQIKSEEIKGCKIYYDVDSPHLYHTNFESTQFYFGGYLSEEHGWSSGKHVSERPGVWGEWIAFKFNESEYSDRFSVVKVYNSPSGSWPIYYGEMDGRAAISNDPLFVALTIGSTQLDLRASLELLTYSHTLNTQTTIKNVKKLSYDEIINFEVNEKAKIKIIKKPYFSQYKYSNLKTSPARTFKILRDTIYNNTSIANKFPVSNLQISGGLDSRLTLAVLQLNFLDRPLSQTLYISNSFEVKVANQVAVNLGFSHKIIYLEGFDGKSEYLLNGWLLTGGQVSIHAAAGNLIFYEKANEVNGEKIIIGGWPGDCLIGSYIPNTPLMVWDILSKFAIARWVAMRGYTLTNLGISFNENSKVKKILKMIDRSLVKKIYYNSGKNAAQKISYWAMFDRQPSFSYIAPSNLTSKIIQLTPLLSDSYLKELMKLTAHDLIEKNFYRKLFNINLSNLANIPLALTGKIISDKVSRIQYFPKNLIGLLYLMPSKFIKSFVSILRNLKLIFSSKVTKKIDVSVENKFWRKQLLEIQFPNKLVIEGVELSNNGDILHAQSVFLTLYLTQEYIKSAQPATRNLN